MSIEVSANLPREAFSNDASRAGAVEIGHVADAVEWDQLIAAAAFPHLPQSFAYGEGKRAKGWRIVRASFSIANRIVAIVQVLERRVLGIRILTRINRGPLFMEADPADEVVRAVYSAIRRRWGRYYGGALLIAPALATGEASHARLRSLGYKLRHDHAWISGRIDLCRSEEEMWAGLDSRFRNRYRGAERSGATLRIADDAETLDWMIARHLENMHDKQFKGIDAIFIRAQATAAQGRVLVFQLLHEGQPVAGMMVVRFGDSCEYHIGWFGEAGRKVNAGNFLMWQIMREMKRRGCAEFDVGGMAEGSGYTAFKRTMRSKEFRLAGEWMSF